MDDEPPLPNSLQAFERCSDPIACLHAIEDGGVREFGVGCGGNQRSHRGFIGLAAEIHFDQPGPAATPASRIDGLLEGRSGGVRRIERLDHDVGDTARLRFIALQPHAVCGVVGWKAFEHVGA